MSILKNNGVTLKKLYQQLENDKINLISELDKLKNEVY